MCRNSVLSGQKRQARLIWTLVIFLIAMTGVWVLNVLNVIEGSWSMIFGAIFTGLGSSVTLLQWHEQTMSKTPCTPELTSADRADLRELFLLRLADKRKGAIIVYVPRAWRGTTLYLVPGLQETARDIEAVSNVVEQRIAGQRWFLCHFPVISPGHYTLVALSKHRLVQTTVYPGHLSEIDWR